MNQNIEQKIEQKEKSHISYQVDVGVGVIISILIICGTMLVVSFPEEFILFIKNANN